MAKPKVIGITCDDYKTEKYRKALLAEGLTFAYDGESGIKQVHLFRVEVPLAEFSAMTQRISKILRKLEIDFKQGN